VRADLRLGDRQWILDTPDHALLGIWLKAIMDDLKLPANSYLMMPDFTLRLT
jgi:hypothetical protein